MKIYVDAMGGDLAPEAPVKGALKALRQYPHLKIVLAGRLDEVKPFLGDYEDVKDRLILEEDAQLHKLDLSLLSEVKRNEKGTVEIRLVDRLKALEQLAAMVGADTHQAEEFLRSLVPEQEQP